ncbi:MAG TPA: glycosyltransferase, partial [Noviherbaspirillum sp.]|nr:glycosyltransferase [Noviherbaspirillum sp.]
MNARIDTSARAGGDKRRIVMLGTDFHTKGGISSVVNVYRETGLFERFPIVYLASHVDGPASQKIRYFATAWVRYMAMLLMGRVAAVHIHVSTDMSFWRKLTFILPTYAFGVPAILHLHGADFDTWYARGPKFKQWIMRYAFDRAASLLVLSQSWRKWAQSVSRNPSIVSIYNPVRVPTATEYATRDAASLLFLG